MLTNQSVAFSGNSGILASATMATTATATPPPAPKSFAQLPAKHQCFIYEYLHDLDAKNAYVRAGYKDSPAAKVAGHLLLTKLNLYIEPLIKSKVQAVGYSADDTMREIAMIARATPEAPISWRDKLFALQLMGRYHGVFTPTPTSKGLVVVIQPIASGHDQRAKTIELQRPQLSGPKQAVKATFAQIPAGPKPTGKGKGKP